MLEPLVYQDDDETRRQVHQERRHADGQDVAHDLAAQAVNAAPEMEQFALVRKDVELPDERDNLRQHRGDGRAADTPPEAIDEQRVERRVDDHRIDGSVHRLARMPRSPQHGVQAQIHVRDDVPHEDDRHVVAGITDRRLARPEKVEDRIEQQQRYETECQANDEVQHHDVAQDVLRRLVVSLPEAHGHQRRSTHTHQRTESRGEVHQREGQRKARNGQRPYPVADEDTVDHVVERRSRHGDDRRHGILHEQLADTLRPKLRRRPFYRCRHIIYYQLCPSESRTNYPTIP